MTLPRAIRTELETLVAQAPVKKAVKAAKGESTT